MDLVVPAAGHLPSYSEALARGWSPDTIDPAAGRQQLARIHADPVVFLEELDDPDGRGAPVVLPDGSTVRRLPSIRRWMWDDGFVGSIGFRWRPGTPELPPYVLGHIGYSVVPWARRRGYATAALGQLLGEVVDLGLPYVDITTDVENIASQRVITANGGVLVERFLKPAAYGTDQPALRWRIALHDGEPTAPAPR
jgi:predicted acetyltransferase